MLKRITVSIVVCLLLCTAFFSACGKSETAGKVYYRFTDSNGDPVTLAKKPERVAVLFSSYADIWKTAGGQTDITVGESIDRGFAPVTAVLVDKGAGKTINREALVRAQADFVIGSADIPAQAEAVAFMREIGIAAASFRVDSFDDYLTMLKICTDITGESKAYTHYGTEVKERIEKLLSSTQQQPEKKILFIRSGSGYSSTKAKTAKDNFVCAMLQELNTVNIAEKAAVLLDGLSIEEILIADPEYIFISTMGNEAAAKAYMDSLLSGPIWKELSAVKQGAYAYLPKDLFQFKPNARWDKAYEYLIGLLTEKK